MLAHTWIAATLALIIENVSHACVSSRLRVFLHVRIQVSAITFRRDLQEIALSLSLSLETRTFRIMTFFQNILNK